MKQEPMVTVDHDVAMLDEHLLRDNDGSPLVYLNEKMLQAFADKLTTKFKETGDAVPLTDGHTRDVGNSQPEILGYAFPPWKVKKLYNSDRMALFSGKVQIRKSKVELARTRPRRSVEIWPSRWDIDPIALLGAETPDRFLGPMRLTADGKDRSFTRVIGDNMDPSMVQQIAAAVMAQIMETSQMKFLDELQKTANEAEVAPPAAAAPPVAPAGPPVDPEGGAPGLDIPGEQDTLPPEEGAEGEEGPPVEEEEEEPPIQKSASLPSGSNTFAPKVEKVKLSRDRDQLAIKVAHLEEELKALRGEKEMAVKLAREKSREADLIQLEAEGYELSRQDELAEAEEFRMNEAQWSRKLGVIRKQYGKDVTKVSRFPNEPAPIRKQAGVTAEIVERARDMALDTNRPFESCLTELSQQS
jgi:hypothetical protein